MSYFLVVKVPASTIEDTRQVMDVSGPGLRNNAQGQLLAAWMNLAQGAVGWDELIDTGNDSSGDALFRQVVVEAETILLDAGAPKGQLEQAKNLAEVVNLHDANDPVCAE